MKKLLSLLVICVLVAGCVGQSSENTEKITVVNDDYDKPDDVELANPAAVYCIENDGKLIPITDDNGTGSYCKLNDGRICEEWSFFNSNGEICDELMVAFTSNNDCFSSCIDDGYVDGLCLLPSMADELEFNDIGDCFIDMDLNCDTGECFCYCSEEFIS